MSYSDTYGGEPVSYPSRYGGQRFEGLAPLPAPSEDVSFDLYGRADYIATDGAGAAAQWIDPLAGTHMEQLIASARGAWDINGWAPKVPTVLFEGTKVGYTNPSGASLPNGPSGKRFGYIVCDVLSIPAARWYGLDSQADNILYCLAINTSFEFGFWDNPNWRGSGTVLSTGKQVLAWEHKAGFGMRLHRNGVLLATLAANNHAMTTPNGFGSDDVVASHFCHMRGAEICFGRGSSGAGNDEIKNEDKAVFNGYIAARYGIAGGAFEIVGSDPF